MVKNKEIFENFFDECYMERIMIRRSSITALLLVFIAGCAAVPMKPMIDNSFFFQNRYDKVWEVTLKVLEKKAIAIKEISKEKGEIVTKLVYYSDKAHAHQDIENIAEKPGSRLALYTKIRYSFTIKINPVNDMITQVIISSEIEAYDSEDAQNWLKCISKNNLERDLLDALRSSM